MKTTHSITIRGNLISVSADFSQAKEVISNLEREVADVRHNPQDALRLVAARELRFAGERVWLEYSNSPLGFVYTDDSDNALIDEIETAIEGMTTTKE